MESRRHLIVLLDGTWVTAADPEQRMVHSNIYELNLALDTHSRNNEAQITFYIPGIGAMAARSKGPMQAAAKMFAGALGLGLLADVEQAYINLASNYTPGSSEAERDKIYIFGFSRGAVAARLLAGLISEFGLLKATKINYFPELWKAYLEPDYEPARTRPVAEEFCHKVPVEFLGVFDTVLGYYAGTDRKELIHKFRRNRSVPRAVKHAVHLLAINESRKEFKPALWNDVEDAGTYVSQVWMPGVHSDIGGGYAKDFLAKAARLTMFHEIRRHTQLKLYKGCMTTLTKEVESGLAEAANERSDGIWLNGTGPDRDWAPSNFWSRTRLPDGSNKHQRLHPICSLLQNRYVVIAPETRTKYDLGPPPLDFASIRLFDAMKTRLFRTDEKRPSS